MSGVGTIVFCTTYLIGGRFKSTMCPNLWVCVGILGVYCTRQCEFVVP